MAAELKVVQSTPVMRYDRTFNDYTESRENEHVTLVASNGERLMHGEKVIDGPRAREAVINAMVEVLRAEGWEVRK